ncbi:MAG TPA: hypothetical protein VF077_13320 [Nitrospiraceae bacterium]
MHGNIRNRGRYMAIRLPVFSHQTDIDITLGAMKTEWRQLVLLIFNGKAHMFFEDTGETMASPENHVVSMMGKRR